MFKRSTYQSLFFQAFEKTTKGFAVFTLVTIFFSGTEIKSQFVAKAETEQLAAPQAVFTNSTPITIPNSGNGSVYPSAITASGVPTELPATPGAIKVTINGFSHTCPEDVGIVLVAPNGDALLLQDNVGGDCTDVSNVTYTLSDDGATRLPNSGAWTAGTYQPTSHGFTGRSFPAPGPGTTYTNPFISGPWLGNTFGGDNPNGTWNLFVRDFFSPDGGTIAGGWTLEIADAGPTLPPQHVLDFDGNGRTDPTLVRNTGGGPQGQITWFIGFNGPGGINGYEWGLTGDSFVPADYDGDNKTDIAVWRSGAPTVAAFYILQSATNTVRIEPFGQTGDNPRVVGDYDGDGAADVAVYRSGASSGDPSTWFYRGTMNNPSGNVTYVPWGQNGDFPAPGDYDGDGRNDFVVQRDNNGFGQARFWMLQSTAGFNSIIFGTRTDRIAPGDYDGDGKTDLAVVRGSAGQLNWFVRRSSTGAVTQEIWGLSATDFPTPGDYDGDGRTDPAIWRPSSTPGQSLFWWRGSTFGPRAVAFGSSGDYPPANAYVF